AERATYGSPGNRGRGARDQGKRHKCRRPGLAHDGASRGEPPSGHDRGTLPDRGRLRRGRHVDPHETAPPCRGPRPGGTPLKSHRAGARGPRGFILRLGLDRIRSVQRAHPLNTARTVTAKFRVEAIAANATLTAVRGVRVGHAHGLGRRTGTTVVLPEPPA